MSDADDEPMARDSTLPSAEKGSVPRQLHDLETAVLDACAGSAQWPVQVAAGVYAGVDFAIANPGLETTLSMDVFAGSDSRTRYEWLVSRLAGFLRVRAPLDRRLPASTDEAVVAGIVGLVGDHLRIGRLDRLAELRPDLVLLTLLPYLGFAEAQRWANLAAQLSSSET